MENIAYGGKDKSKWTLISRKNRMNKLDCWYNKKIIWSSWNKNKPMMELIIKLYKLLKRQGSPGSKEFTIVSYGMEKPYYQLIIRPIKMDLNWSEWFTKTVICAKKYHRYLVADSSSNSVKLNQHFLPYNSKTRNWQ